MAAASGSVIIGLSDADRAVLQEVIRRFNASNIPHHRTQEDAPGTLPPGIYLAKAKSSSGIPAATGSGESITPGKAECDLYRISDEGSSVKLEKADVTENVYNISKAKISQELVVAVKLAHGGKCVAVQSAPQIAAVQLGAELTKDNEVSGTLYDDVGGTSLGITATITGKLLGTRTLDAGTWGYVAPAGGNKWKLIAAECPDEEAPA